MNKSLEESALREAGFHHHANTYLLPIQIQPGEDDALAAVLDQLQKAIGRLVPSTKILDKPKG